MKQVTEKLRRLLIENEDLLESKEKSVKYIGELEKEIRELKELKLNLNEKEKALRESRELLTKLGKQLEEKTAECDELIALTQQNSVSNVKRTVTDRKIKLRFRDAKIDYEPNEDGLLELAEIERVIRTKILAIKFKWESEDSFGRSC